MWVAQLCSHISVIKHPYGAPVNTYTCVGTVQLAASNQLATEEVSSCCRVEAAAAVGLNCPPPGDVYQSNEVTYRTDWLADARDKK